MGRKSFAYHRREKNKIDLPAVSEICRHSISAEDTRTRSPAWVSSGCANHMVQASAGSIRLFGINSATIRPLRGEHLRFSPHLYNTMDEIDEALSVLNSV
jgi:selenocysteine lyase/cysteine desulfurase